MLSDAAKRHKKYVVNKEKPPVAPILNSRDEKNAFWPLFQSIHRNGGKSDVDRIILNFSNTATHLAYLLKVSK